MRGYKFNSAPISVVVKWHLENMKRGRQVSFSGDENLEQYSESVLMAEGKNCTRGWAEVVECDLLYKSFTEWADKVYDKPSFYSMFAVISGSSRASRRSRPRRLNHEGKRPLRVQVAIFPSITKEFEFLEKTIRESRALTESCASLLVEFRSEILN